VDYSSDDNTWEPLDALFKLRRYQSENGQIQLYKILEDFESAAASAAASYSLPKHAVKPPKDVVEEKKSAGNSAIEVSDSSDREDCIQLEDTPPTPIALSLHTQQPSEYESGASQSQLSAFRIRASQSQVDEVKETPSFSITPTQVVAETPASVSRRANECAVNFEDVLRKFHQLTDAEKYDVAAKMRSWVSTDGWKVILLKQ
jgi:hypothetical protein